MSGLVSSVRRALSSKLRGPGFKSPPDTVGGPGYFNTVRCSDRLKPSFELNPVTEDKQGIFSFLFVSQ